MLDRMLSFYSVKILLSTSIKILLPTLNKFSTCDSFIHKTYQIVGSLSPLISNKSTTSTFRKELKIFLDCLFPLLSDKNARSYAALLSVKILLTTSTKKKLLRTLNKCSLIYQLFYSVNISNCWIVLHLFYQIKVIFHNFKKEF
jgi:hypothetical protein